MPNKQSSPDITLSIKPGGGKLIELDLMKFYGILLVVLGHVAFCYTDMGAVKPALASDTMKMLKDIIYAFHMPMFVFVSGFIFAYQLEVKKREQTLWKLITDKFKRLIIPYYVFAFLWVLPTMCLLHLRSPISYAKGLIFGLDPRHLWYVMMLFEAFILMHILRWICEKVKLPQSLILLVATLLYSIPSLVPLPGFTSWLQLSNLMNYFLWFTLGYFFVIYRNRNIAKYLAAFFITCTMIQLLTPIAVPHLMATTANAITGISIFYLISLHTTKLSKYREYQIISRNSFGIYLFHAMLIYILEYEFSSYRLNSLILTVVVFATSLLLSVILTECVRRIKLGIIIGE